MTLKEANIQIALGVLHKYIAITHHHHHTEGKNRRYIIVIAKTFEDAVERIEKRKNHIVYGIYQIHRDD